MYIPEHKKKEIDILNFECKRLKDVLGNSNIRSRIDVFSSKMNPGLGQYLHLHAGNEEKNNFRAFYLILDGEDIVMYFSLQTGATIKCDKKIVGGIVFDKRVDDFTVDKDKIEVDTVIPVIEIPHLCVNDHYRNRVKSWKVNYKGTSYNVGQFVFYKFIVPIVLDVAEKIGLQHLILFCADNDEGKLEEYYRKLGFSRMNNMACLRDSYSADLECLSIKIEKLIEKYHEFEKPDYSS